MRSWLLLFLCSCSSHGPSQLDPDASPDATSPSANCTSSHAQTADPACLAAPNYIITFASYSPSWGVAHGVPGANFPTPIEHAVTARPSVAVDTCLPVGSAAPACPACDPGMYCHPDGTCQSTPYASDHDVGPIELAVDGTVAGSLAYDGSSYEPAGELATRVEPLWRLGGEHLTATHADFALALTTPAVPEVTSFTHSIDAQIEPAYQDLALTWRAGDPNDILEISIGTAFTYTRCLAADDGSWSVPWSVFEDIAKGEGGELFIFVDRTRRAVVPTAVGPVELIARASDNQQFAFSIGE